MHGAIVFCTPRYRVNGSVKRAYFSRTASGALARERGEITPAQGDARFAINQGHGLFLGRGTHKARHRCAHQGGGTRDVFFPRGRRSGIFFVSDSRPRHPQGGQALEAMHLLVLWLIPNVEKFPRDCKFLLGERIQSIRNHFIETLCITIT